MKKWATAAFIAAIVFGPAAYSNAASHKAPVKKKVYVCPVAPNAATAAIFTSSTAAAKPDVYFTTTTPGLWQESNGKAGLQTTARAHCWAADTQVTPNMAAPSAPGTPSVPNPPVAVPAVPKAPSTGGAPSVPGAPNVTVPQVPSGAPNVTPPAGPAAKPPTVPSAPKSVTITVP
jgi:hypothetical protein